MRQITADAIRAFRNRESFRRDNTEVVVSKETVTLKLHGNSIAKIDTGTNELLISNAGWESRTTYERLNGLPNVHINVKRGQTYLNGEVWDGSWTEIK